MTKAPFPKLPRGLGLRQRQRADGTWRLWWEPSAEQRKHGVQVVELDPNRPTWSKREAEKLKTGQAGEPARRTASGGRTIDALIAEYMRSPRFKSKIKPKTQDGYRADFRVISEKWGNQPVALFDRPVVYTWYETLYAKAPTYAGKIIRSLSVLFSYAELVGWRPANSNPCFRLSLEPAKKRSRSASWAEYDALIAAAVELGRPSMACAIALATFSASRQADVVSAELEAFSEMELPGDEEAAAQKVWVWAYVRSKRSNAALIPVHEEVAPYIATQKDTARKGQTTLLVNDITGEPYSGDLFRAHWQDIRLLAAKKMPTLLHPVLQFRDLRRTFGVWSRAGGAMKEDVGDVLGNSAGTDWQLGEVYMPAQLTTAMRAVGAIQRPKAKGRKTA